ncbi:MAG TPA: glycerol-3-phosphate acyltransferase [Patescibacteria group bacterium]|nr:glycerol-3-phosphate acyltransferase [Patescibacteria group bacterium]
MITLITALSYFIGAIPVAYFLVKLRSGQDITREGSGNVGAMNSFEVTGSKSIGIITGILDALKGFTAVMLARWIGGEDFFLTSLAAFFVVFGHNMNVFLKFKGGRGLAPAAGALLAINPLPVLFWGLMWTTGYFILRRDVHVGNMAGTIGAPVLLYTTPDLLLKATMLVPLQSLMTLNKKTGVSELNFSNFKILVFMICVLIFIKHLEPIQKLFRENHEEV